MKLTDWRRRNIYISDRTWERLRLLAIRNGETLSSLIRRTLERVK